MLVYYYFCLELTEEDDFRSCRGFFFSPVVFVCSREIRRFRSEGVRVDADVDEGTRVDVDVDVVVDVDVREDVDVRVDVDVRADVGEDVFLAFFAPLSLRELFLWLLVDGFNAFTSRGLEAYTFLLTSSLVALPLYIL